jgi:hypothetical protein
MKCSSRRLKRPRDLANVLQEWLAMVESVMGIGLRLSGVFCRLRFVSLYTLHFFWPDFYYSYTDLFR